MNSLTAIRRPITVVALLASTVLLTGCEAPHVEPQAKALVAQLSAIDHVTSVGFDHEEMGGWEADEVDYLIEVAPGTSADEVGQVAEAVYDTIRDDDDVTQAAVSATLHLDDDLVTLRIYQSLTEADEVASVVEALVPQLAQGRTTLEVDTSMREADEPVDLSVNQLPDRAISPSQVRRAEASWQELIDRVGRGGAHVGRGPSDRY